jgi:hypothetical protein
MGCNAATPPAFERGRQPNRQTDSSRRTPCRHRAAPGHGSLLTSSLRRLDREVLPGGRRPRAAALPAQAHSRGALPARAYARPRSCPVYSDGAGHPGQGSRPKSRHARLPSTNAVRPIASAAERPESRTRLNPTALARFRRKSTRSRGGPGHWRAPPGAIRHEPASIRGSAAGRRRIPADSASRRAPLDRPPGLFTNGVELMRCWLWVATAGREARLVAYQPFPPSSDETAEV